MSRHVGRGTRVSPEILKSLESKQNLGITRGTSGEKQWEKWIEAFISWKAGNGRQLADRTILDYRKHISQFYRRFPGAIDSGVIDECVKAYFSEDIAPATHNLRRSNLKGFFSFLTLSQQEQGGTSFCPGPILVSNPLKRIQKRRDDGRIRSIKDESVDLLLDKPDITSFVGLRDKTLLLLQVDTAIRPGEALDLSVDDLRLDEKCISVPARIAKARRARTLPLSRETINFMSALLELRKEYEIEKTVPLFCTSDSRPLKYDSWYRRFVEYSKSAGIKLRPYDLRHYAALVYYENNGHDILKLQAFAGHVTLEMTRRYVKYSGSDLIASHELFSPLNGRKKVGNVAA